MKILIGYDGSECSDTALADLKNAGLPKDTEALVLSLVDVILPPPLDEGEESFPTQEPAAVKHARQRAELKLKEAESIAKQASEKLKKDFSEWNIRSEALADSPAWALLTTADDQKADLIVVGAHGHSVLGGRLILGSVSQRVLYEARCSVRVARGRGREPGSPLRLLIGVDNSPDSNAAMEAVIKREWPAGTEVCLLAVVDTVIMMTGDPSEPGTLTWIGGEDEDDRDKVRQIFEPSADKLRSAGLDATVTIKEGNPKDQIVEEAENWQAHCVFLGAKGTRGIDRLLLGSVSSAVAARAHCSVEVVRPTT
jgi:nucleotide-binding universal stress UspA family protein